MNTTTEDTPNTPTDDSHNEAVDPKEEQTASSYRIQFRPAEQLFSAESRIANLKKDEVVMVQTDHGLEPALIIGLGPILSAAADQKTISASHSVIRRANREETEKYSSLMEREKEAFDVCQQFIEKHGLAMKLIKVERFFNGSKIIFYFTAENRVDFRELVKDLVQEFRTRVEIRQIGVRHETKMIGGIGCCGRELCCCSYITKFQPVSIKMAKEQNLPLNPAKISGICNRLLCCLTYEYDTYHQLRKKMPKVGKNITLSGKMYKVLQQDILGETINVCDPEEQDKLMTLSRKDWEKAQRPGGSPKSEKQTAGKKQQLPPKEEDQQQTEEK